MMKGEQPYYITRTAACLSFSALVSNFAPPRPQVVYYLQARFTWGQLYITICHQGTTLRGRCMHVHMYSTDKLVLTSSKHPSCSSHHFA